MLGIFKERKTMKVPEVLVQQEDPVNYNSVLDYLCGLSRSDYSKMIKSADIYREANAKVAKIVGVKDEPTTQIKSEKPTDEEIDEGIDEILNAGPDVDLEFEDLQDTPQVDGLKKPQSASKKVEVK